MMITSVVSVFLSYDWMVIKI